MGGSAELELGADAELEGGEVLIFVLEAVLELELELELEFGLR
jgi:hypothetical protein